jgi:hypothetical protein
MKRHHNRSCAAVAQRSPTRRQSPAVNGLGSSVTQHRTIAAASGRVSKKSTLLRTPIKGSPQASREDLERQLAEAELRILELEARLNGVTDRIAWIADRLHQVLDDRE